MTFKHPRVILIGCVSLLLAACASAPAPQHAAAQHPSIEKAQQVMDAFMTTFNARDEKAWAATLHYPHIRVASGEVRIAQGPGDIEAEMDFDLFAKVTGWDHSAWDSINVLHAGDDKVHFSVEFTRYDTDGTALKTYQSLYVVTRRGEKWGIQARSSFAP